MNYQELGSSDPRHEEEVFLLLLVRSLGSRQLISVHSSLTSAIWVLGHDLIETKLGAVNS